MKVFTNLNAQNLEKEMQSLPKYIPIYTNYYETDHEITIELTKKKGQRLFALLEQDRIDVFEVLSNSDTVINADKINTTNVTENKRSRQAKLFGFMVKK